MSIKIRFMVYNAFGIGGTVKTVFNFADYFQRTGKYNVEIVSIKKTKDTPILYLNPKVKIISIQDARRGAKYSDEDRILLEKPSELIHVEEDLYQMFNAYTDKRLKSWLESLHDGVLITTIPSFNMLAATLVDDKVLKIGQEHKSYADHPSGIQQLIRNHYGKLDALTILTEKNKHIYERKIKGDIPIYVLGNGTERLPFRASLKNHIIITAGRYSEEKGYDLLIEAFALIANQCPDWIIKIYGEGGLIDQYKILIKKYSLENRIILESGSSCMDEKLSEASINVCSSYREAFGMVIIEGFAMGIPCVSFACDGPCEVITNEYDGLIVPKGNIEALASAMLKLISDEEYRMMLGKNAYETAKKYDISMIGQRFKSIIEGEMKLKPERVIQKEINAESEKLQIKEMNRFDFGFSYDQMVGSASEGKIGMKTICKMFMGWIHYKMRKIRH